MSAKQIYFLHIAKTAGTSFRNLLDSQYSEGEISPTYLTHELADLVNGGAGLASNASLEPAEGSSPSVSKQASGGRYIKYLTNYPLIRGHMGWTLVPYLQEFPRIITMLRDPIARTISHYRHICREDSHWMYEHFKGRDVSIEEFLEYPPARQLVANFQTRNLAETWNLEVEHKDRSGEVITPSLGRLMACGDVAADEPDIFMLARERLGQCEFIGVTERFGEAIAELQRVFGWKFEAGNVPLLNSAPREEVVIQPDIRRKIEEITVLDRALHESANKIFDMRREKATISGKIFNLMPKVKKSQETNRPDFLCIGAQKAGTTWLHKHLSGHPDIYMPAKEVHFWDIFYDRGARWYGDLFAGTGKIQGEITPSYSILPPERIREIYDFNPDLKIIYITRGAKERAWSHALMDMNKRGLIYEDTPDSWFEAHFQSEASRRRGDYDACMAKWLSIFPGEQFLLLSYDDIVANPGDLLIRLCGYIGVGTDYIDSLSGDALAKKVFSGGNSSAIRKSLLPALNKLYPDSE